MDGWGANHDATNAVMEARARARAGGAPTIPDPPDGRLMRLTMGFVWSAVAVATVCAAVWAFGGSPTTIVAAAIATAGALLLLVAWRLVRSVRRGALPPENLEA